MRTTIRLWCHEVSREFADRLIDLHDLNFYEEELRQTIIKYFCSHRPSAANLSSKTLNDSIGRSSKELLRQ